MIRNFLTVGQIVRKRQDWGIDWSQKRQVLVMLGSKELWWMLPGKCWSGNYCPWEYVATRLMLFDYARGHDSHRELQEGGRLTAKLIAAHAAAINEYFDGREIADQIVIGKTLTTPQDLRKYHGKTKR